MAVNMTYYASFGELLLITSLLLASHKSFHSNHEFTSKAVIAGSMLFVAITACFGAVRFAGIDSVITIHDNMSWLATNLAMPLYALSSANLFAPNKKLSNGLIGLFVVNTLFSVFITTAFTNVVLFIALAFIAYFSVYRRQTVKAMVALILVPLTALLPISYDLQMGLFHVLLACHFYLISDVYQTKQD